MRRLHFSIHSKIMFNVSVINGNRGGKVCRFAELPIPLSSERVFGVCESVCLAFPRFPRSLTNQLIARSRLRPSITNDLRHFRLMQNPQRYAIEISVEPSNSSMSVKRFLRNGILEMWKSECQTIYA